MTITVSISLLLILLVIFQIKHFLADFTLQIGSSYLIRKFDKTKWAIPLAVHCGHHAGLTLNIVFITTFNFMLSLLLALFDFTIHFITDRIKAHPNLFGRFDPSHKIWWFALATDQAIHHVTHYIIIIIILFNIQ